MFFVNPVDNSIWTEEHSRIVNGDGTSEKVPSSFYGELSVESSKNQFFKSKKGLDKGVRTKRSEENNLLDKFLSQKSLLKPGEHDRPIMDRLWDAAPVFRQRDEK